MTSPKQPPKAAGFTTTELIVTLFIGATFVIVGNSLFSIASQDGIASRNRSIASNLVSSHLSKEIATEVGCSEGDPDVAEIPGPPDTPLADPEITRSISWPYGCSGAASIKRVEVAMTYGLPDDRIEVVHARFVQE